MGSWQWPGRVLSAAWPTNFTVWNSLFKNDPFWSFNVYFIANILVLWIQYILLFLFRILIVILFWIVSISSKLLFCCLSDVYSFMLDFLRHLVILGCLLIIKMQVSQTWAEALCFWISTINCGIHDKVEDLSCFIMKSLRPVSLGLSSQASQTPYKGLVQFFASGYQSGCHYSGNQVIPRMTCHYNKTLSKYHLQIYWKKDKFTEKYFKRTYLSISRFLR